MNVNPIIFSALAPLNVPVDVDLYKPVNDGDPPPDEYITFNYVTERDIVYADGEPLAGETIVQVHYFTRGDPSEKKPVIRRLLRDAGFAIDSIEQFYEDDTKLTHVVITAYIEDTVID